MKKSLRILPFLLFGVSGCATSSASAVSSASSVSSSSSLTAEEKVDKINTFLALLKTKEGQVRSSHAETLRTAYYLTNSEPLTTEEKDTSDFVRYGTSSVGPIREQKGSYSIKDTSDEWGTPSLYEVQVFHDAKSFYRITHYEDSTETSSKKTLAYNAAYEEANLSLSLPNEESQLFPTLIAACSVSNNVVTFSFPTVMNDNATYAYDYSITVNDDVTGVIIQYVCYQRSIVIKNGFIASMKETLENDRYAGGKKTNWMTNEITATYAQGAYGEYAGTPFDPTQFPEG
jgi:hypothetical protein